MRLFFAIFIIIFLVPQTPVHNKVILTLLDMNFFAHYGATKKAVTILNWGSIFFFLLLSIAAGIR